MPAHRWMLTRIRFRAIAGQGQAILATLATASEGCFAILAHETVIPLCLERVTASIVVKVWLTQYYISAALSCARGDGPARCSLRGGLGRWWGRLGRAQECPAHAWQGDHLATCRGNRGEGRGGAWGCNRGCNRGVIGGVITPVIGPSQCGTPVSSPTLGGSRSYHAPKTQTLFPRSLSP